MIFSRQCKTNIYKFFKYHFITREELVKLVEEIITWEGTEEELTKKLELFRKSVPHPSPINLIYWDNLTPEKIVDKALNYKPIQL